MLPDRLQIYRQSPLTELLGVLLRQLRRPLAGHGCVLTDADCDQLAHALIARQPLGDTGASLRAALLVLVDESLSVLAGWGLTFEQSIITAIDALPHWQTTADFLELATEKTNAELRISTAAALLLVMGERQYADVMLTSATRAGDLDSELEAIIAQRILWFALDLAPDQPDWLAVARAQLGG